MEDMEEGRGMETAVSVPATQEELRKEIEKTFKTVRPELNIEKHADFIFAPSHSKSVGKPRSKTLPDGTKVKASILVEPFRGKTPTTKTRKVYLALQRLWEEKGWNEEEKTVFSSNEIAEIVGWKWAGKRTMKETYDELLQARWTPIFWEHSFVNENGERVTIKDSFSLLDHLKIIEKRERTSNQIFLSLSSFRFNEEIRKNLKANRTKPTNLVALELQGEIASVLYARLDIMLADKPQYERATAGLFKDLYLEGNDYHKPSVRKRMIEKAIKELEAKPISTGILHLRLERTADGKDWKLVATKSAFLSKKDKPNFAFAQRVAPPNPPEAIPFLAEDIGLTIGQQETNHPLYILLCKTYSQDILYQALSEWKADGGREARNPRGYFMAILHRIAHRYGKLWMNKNCPENCKYRPLLS
jgi:hypothetical protein